MYIKGSARTYQYFSHFSVHLALYYTNEKEKSFMSKKRKEWTMPTLPLTLRFFLIITVNALNLNTFF